jgi:hypothetical protein
MTTTTFDTLAYSKTLQEAGFPKEQAEAMTTAQADALKGFLSARELATKNDIKDLRFELRERLSDTKHEILKWVIGVAIGQAALLIAVMALFR